MGAPDNLAVIHNNKVSNPADPFLNSMDNIKASAGMARMNTFDAERHNKGNIFGTQ